MQYKKKSQEWLPNGVASSCLLVVYHQMIVHAFLTVLIRQRSNIAPVMDPIHYVTVEVEAIDQFAQVWFSSITHKYITSYRPTSIRKLSSCCSHLRILRHQVMLMNIKNINLSNIAHRHTHTHFHTHTHKMPWNAKAVIFHTCVCKANSNILLGHAVIGIMRQHSAWPCPLLLCPWHKKLPQLNDQISVSGYLTLKLYICFSSICSL